MSRPPVVNIQVARTCNLRCTFCSHDVWAKPTGMMEWSLFERVIERLKEDDVLTVCFVSAQGEPMLHPRIFDMLSAAVDAGFETNLVTNGTPLNARRIALLASLELDAIQFSFAGWDKTSYERLYVGGKFERVVVNLTGLIEALRGNRTAFTVNGIVEEPEGIDLTTSFLQGLGLRRSQIRVTLPHNWGGTVKAGVEQDGIYSHRAIDRKTFRVCPILKSTQGVYIDGTVTACGCIDANGALAIGDIREQPISGMRTGSRYRGMVDAFSAGDVSGLPLCNSCEIPYHPWP